ncbi:hypothetical protein LTS18_010552 [Coniosporium uncinatum]|uniref:Uncharacterized protein n=1 Tax=Coniosporium uncinatum TaxID=93489 RepID=A0ACC3D9N6_9PEZI|nr:hypothetical protein LTS18_010552 [Coniosporium uncinatum]
MWQKSVLLCESVAAELANGADDGKGFEINHWSNKVTMDIIGIAGLGRDFNALKNSDDELIQNYEEILEPTTEKVMFFACQILGPQRLIDRLPWAVNKRMSICTSALSRICKELVVQKREAVKANADQNLDILSVLIKSNNFADEQLVDQMLTFLAAGHETTSSAFTWATHLLAIHPEIQKRLREEIQEKLPSNPWSEVDLTGLLEGLPLLNGVCNETLRLYPTVPITVRDTIRDTTLVGQPIPKGTQILLSPWAINRSPHLWGDEAQVFKPERWINPETGGPNKTGGATSNYDQLTFLHGPRSCIGQGFAMAELRCLVAAFVGAFELEMARPNEPVIPAGVVTTKPASGMWLKLKTLKAW